LASAAQFRERLFTDFAERELESGGPDPQVRLVATAIQDEVHRAWMAGCFVAPYTCGAAAAIWHDLAPYETRDYSPLVAQWLREHWEGIPIRRERRAVWKPEKLAECLESYTVWAEGELLQILNEPYDVLYTSVLKHVKFFGRYAAMKVLEVLHLAGVTAAGQCDIRPRGARFPRSTLAWIWPEAGHDPRSSAAEQIEQAIQLSLRARALLPDGTTWFQTETLLCNFRQALAGKYPGRSHDRELAHFLRAEAHWGRERLLDAFPFYELRRELFPWPCLGELNGWSGARKELETVYDRCAYFWVDTRYDYSRTTDVGDPVKR
jgi:hypothetical protein